MARRHPEAPLIRSARVRLHASIYEPDNPYGSSPWRQKHGALWDIGPHALSVLLPVLGPVTELRALRGRDDEVEVLTKHYSGAMGSMSFSLTSPAADRSAEWTVYGADTMFVLPDSDEPPIAAYTHMIGDLLADRPGPWSHPCDIHFGREVTHVLAKADEAVRNNS